MVSKIGLNDLEIFDSSWMVKCLFCKDAIECQYPTRPENIDYVLKRIDEDLERAIDHPAYDELSEEAKLVKERVKVEGSSAASVLYFFGKK